LYWELIHSWRRIHHGLASFLAAATLGKQNLCAGRKKIGNGFKRTEQSRKEAWLGDHVIVEHTHMREPRAPDAAIHRFGKRHGLRAVFDYDIGIRASEKARGIVRRAVIHHDDLVRVSKTGQTGGQELAPVTRGNHHRDASR